MKYTTIVNDQTFAIEIERDGSVLVNGKRHEVDWLELGASLYSIITDMPNVFGPGHRGEPTWGSRVFGILDKSSNPVLTLLGVLEANEEPRGPRIVAVVRNLNDECDLDEEQQN